MIITELCVSGAMHRGIVEIGALRALEELGILNVKKVSGTSIGAVVLFMHIIGYTCSEIMDVVLDTDISLFGDFAPSELNRSVFKGSIIRNWLISIGKNCSE